MTPERAKALHDLIAIIKGSTDVPHDCHVFIKRHGGLVLKLLQPPAQGEVAEAVEEYRAWQRGERHGVLPQTIETLIQAATQSPYQDYTWEDVAILVQENKILKEAATLPAQGTEVDVLVKALEENLKTFKAIEEGTSKHPNIRAIASGLCNFIFGCTHEAIKFTEFTIEQAHRPAPPQRKGG